MSASFVPSSRDCAFPQTNTSPMLAEPQTVINTFSNVVRELASSLHSPAFSLNTELLARLLTEHSKTEQVSPKQTWPCEQEVKSSKRVITKNGDTLEGRFDPHSNHLQDGVFKSIDGTELNGTWVENPKTGRLNFYPKTQSLTSWQQNQLVKDFENSIEFLNEPLCRALRSNFTPKNSLALQKLEASCNLLMNANSLQGYDSALEEVRKNFEECVDVFCVPARSGSTSPKHNNPIHIELISTKELGPTVFQQLELLGKIKFRQVQSI